jgi:hypothetical protein
MAAQATQRARSTVGRPSLSSTARSWWTSDVAYRQMVNDAKSVEAAPGGHVRATLQSSAGCRVVSEFGRDRAVAYSCCRC